MLLAVTLSPLVVASSKTTSQLFMTSCKADDEVSTQERESVGQVALKFVQDALGPNTPSAYSAFTADAKESVPLERFVSGFQNSIKPMGPFKNLRVAHLYLPRVTGGAQEERVVCGNISSPEGWVAVNAKPGPVEAYAIVEGDTVNNTNAFVVWLLLNGVTGESSTFILQL
jgi:hypothetical protein